MCVKFQGPLARPGSPKLRAVGAAGGVGSLRRLPQDALPSHLGSGYPLRAKPSKTGCMPVCVSVWLAVVVECFPWK